MVAIVSETVARRLVGIDDAIAVTESLLVALHEGRSLLFPAVRAHGSDPSTRFGVKAGYDGERGIPGLKVGSYWPGNRARGLPSHGSTTLLLDDATGMPTAIVSATYLTALRTAAMNAVAVKFLARQDAGVLVLLGTGNQSFHDALAIARVRTLREVRVCGRALQGAEALAGRLSQAGLPARAGELRESLAGADILSTATAARSPLLEYDWLLPGCHVSAMGADGPGKQELPAIPPPAAGLWADVPEQSLQMGEFQHGFAAGAFGADAVQPLAALIAGELAGRGSDGEITIFDSSGFALQDIAVCALALERAREAGLAQEIDLG